MTTLISFLGRAQADTQTGYRRTRYRFPDGSERETAFFGLALREHLRADRLVVLGTAGSMWDVLIEHFARSQPDRYEEARLALHEAVEARCVDARLLADLKPLAESALGAACELLLVSSGQGLVEQEDILRRIDAAVPEGEEVVLDVTHGFRHLSMLAVVASRLLSSLDRSRCVRGIWYGAFDMRAEDGAATVVNLEGLERLMSWSEAWRQFEHSGDYGVFVDLIEREDGPEALADALRRASFYERTVRLPEARKCLLDAARILDDAGLPGAGAMFTKRLRDRIAWIEQNDLYEHQRGLARHCLRSGDYVRAAILANEAVLTRWMKATCVGNENRYEDRDEARVALRKRLRRARARGPVSERLERWQRRMNQLADLRNALAHGTVAQIGANRRLLRNPEALERTLWRLIRTLLEEPLPEELIGPMRARRDG